MLVAGVGNVLRADDGFGVAVVDRLEEGTVPDEVEIMDVGIGGIHLVQVLMEHVDGLVIADALRMGRAPGTVLVLKPEVRDVTTLAPQEQRDELADMHYATPERALMLARGLSVLPDRTWLVGCEPVDVGSWSQGLTGPVAQAVDLAADEVRRIVRALGVAW